MWRRGHGCNADGGSGKDGVETDSLAEDVSSSVSSGSVCQNPSVQACLADGTAWTVCRKTVAVSRMTSNWKMVRRIISEKTLRVF